MAKIHGIVKDDNDNPIEGVILSFINKENPEKKDDVESDEEGKFKTISLVAGNYSWTAKKNGFITKNGDIENILGGNVLHDIGHFVLVQLQPGLISGRVTDQAGAGVPNAQVTATDAAGSVSPAVATDANGDYNIPNLVPGAYTVSVVAPAGYQDPAPLPNVQVLAGQDTGNQDFPVAPAPAQPGSISGQVTDQAGAGVQGAQVTATDAAGAVSPAVATDANGDYKIPNLAPGAYTVAVVAPAGYQNPAPLPNIQVQAGKDTGQDFQLVQLGSISGTISDPQSGIGIPGAEVTATDAAGNVFPTAVPAVTDANGDYTIQSLTPGQYTINVKAPAGYIPPVGYQFPGPQVVDVQAGVDSPGNFQLVPAQPGSISGRVTDPAGAGVQGAQVTATDAAGAVSPAVATDANGDYKIPNLAPGAYTVAVVAPSGYLSQRNIQVQAAPVASVNFSPTLPQEFFNFRQKLKGSQFAKDAPVNIDEAMYFYAFYGAIANYMSANVLLAIEILDNFLTSNTPVNGLTLTGQKNLLEHHGTTIDEILEKRRNLSPSEADVINQARRQFNLGTVSIEEDVNTEFQAKFRELVSLCDDDLFGIDLASARKSRGWSPDKTEKFFELLKKVKRIIIELMENMSFFGTDGTLKFLVKWQKIINDAIDILNDVAINHIASDDDDQKHIWSVVAKLNGQKKSQIDSYIVHANQGAAILYYVIKIYEYMINNLEKEDNPHLEDVFQKHQFEEEGNPGVKGSASKLLKTNAGLVLSNWIPEWPT